MKTPKILIRKRSMVCGLLMFLDGAADAEGSRHAAAVAAFNNYMQAVEARLAEQHRSADFLVGREDG